jgi:threonine synthase
LNTLPTHKLLDGAKGFSQSISRESRELSRFICQQETTASERIEAYKDIIDIEIGDTTLTRARNIEREYGFRQLYLKFEGSNPTGTQKDRIAFAQCYDALRRGFDTITVATCGNYGAAIAFAASIAGIHTKIYIPEAYHTLRINEMTDSGAEIIRVLGTYEDAVETSIKSAQTNEWYDANPGGENTPIQLSAYAEIAFEIYDTLRDAPKMIACPVSNGTLLAGIYRGFQSLFKRGKTSRIPIFIAGSSYQKNPIIYSFKKGLKHCMDIDQSKIKESRFNEPLINWHSYDGEEALRAILETKGAAFDISDNKMTIATRLLREKEGLHVLPASTVGLIGMLEMHQQNEFDGDRYVSIITGRR